MYLHVISVGEITTGYGRWISTDGWEGNKNENYDNDIASPDQGNLNASDWAARRRVLTASLCSAEDIRLTLSLGMWLPETTHRLKMWKGFWDYNDKVLYRKHGGGCLKYTNTNEGR